MKKLVILSAFLFGALGANAVSVKCRCLTNCADETPERVMAIGDTAPMCENHAKAMLEKKCADNGGAQPENMKCVMDLLIN